MSYLQVWVVVKAVRVGRVYEFKLIQTNQVVTHFSTGKDEEFGGMWSSWDLSINFESINYPR